MPSIGFPELVVILVIALLLFGRRLPEVARSLGKGISEFKKGVREIDTDIKSEAPEAKSAKATAADKS